ncbi:hypothetical protein WJX81_006395 [Elliptochloris bilobata]|uniref:Chalcone-flavonone isomerase family protein n=1 Tax=Elliptochloris bilobata TaxID=381761 RepID=A0AAW1QZJ2_9CHLO
MRVSLPAGAASTACTRTSTCSPSAHVSAARPQRRLRTCDPFKGGVQSLQASVQSAHRLQKSVGVQCSAPGLVVKEASTGVEFPEVVSLWGSSEKFRSVGAGVRAKKFAFVPVKVYAVTVYVEAEKAARELGVRSRGGFFADDADEDYALALVDGAFAKALVVHLVRKVDGKTFYEALEEALAPRLRLAGEGAALQRFGDFFQGRTLEKGTEVVMLWRTEGPVELALRPEGGPDLLQLTPDLRIEAVSLGRALFEVYLGSNSVVPEARSIWAQGARALLATEQVRRSTT